MKPCKKVTTTGHNFSARNRCFCLILSSQGKSVSELEQFFDISRITIYSRFDAWERAGITGLMNRKGQGRKPILFLQNPAQVEQAKALIAKNPPPVKSVIAELEPKLKVQMHPEALKRFF